MDDYEEFRKEFLNIDYGRSQATAKQIGKVTHMHDSNLLKDEEFVETMREKVKRDGLVATFLCHILQVGEGHYDEFYDLLESMEEEDAV